MSKEKGETVILQIQNLEEQALGYLIRVRNGGVKIES